MQGAESTDWYLRLRREKNTSGPPDKEFTLAQLFTSPYHAVDTTSSSSASGRHKRNGIVGGGILLGRQSSSQQEGPNTRVSRLASAMLPDFARNPTLTQ